MVAILVAFGSVIASQWQFDRHLSRASFSNQVNEQLNKPALKIDSTLGKLPIWQRIKIVGKLDNQVKLLRNRPLDGRNGFWVITTIDEVNGNKIPVLVGWIPSGSSANAVVVPPKFENRNYEILGLIRSFEKAQIAADLPKNQLISFDKSAVVGTTPYFVQILELKPAFSLSEIRTVPIPNISQGPHFFYAIQWLVFAAISLIGAGWMTKSELNVESKRS